MDPDDGIGRNQETNPILDVVVFLLFALLAFHGQDLPAQLADRAVITGVVTDSSGAAIPEAMVTITNEGTGVRTLVGTNGAGNYSTPPLILSTYRVDVEKQGFKTYTETGIWTAGGQTVRVDAKLIVGAAREVVVVRTGWKS